MKEATKAIVWAVRWRVLLGEPLLLGRMNNGFAAGAVIADMWRLSS